MDDFQPDRVARQIAPLRSLLDLRGSLSNLRGTLDWNDRLSSSLEEILRDPQLQNRIRAEGGDHAVVNIGNTAEIAAIVDRVVESARFRGNEEATSCRLWLKDFFDEVSTGKMTAANDVEMMITNRIAALDKLISMQLDEVMHAAPLQRLEASWRGLSYLVQQTETSSSLKIKVLNISKAELRSDFAEGARFDESALCHKICQEEYGSWTATRLAF